VLFDPLEEELHVPSLFVKPGDGNDGQKEVVGQKHRGFFGIGVVIFHQAEFVGIIRGRLRNGQQNGLVAHNSCGFVHWMGIKPAALEIGLGSDHEESGCLGNGIESGEIREAAIHNVESTGFQRDQIQNVDLVEFSIGDMDKAQDVAPQIQQGMETDCSLCCPKSCPGKEGQTQVDRCGIQGVNCVLEFHGQRFLLVEFSGNGDQMMCKIGVDTPTPHLVCFCQGAAGNLAADAHVVEFVVLCQEAGLDVSQAFAISQLSESHHAELVRTTEILDVEVALVQIHTTLKGFQWHEVHDLGEHKRA
jgi:hypothetical protein